MDLSRPDGQNRVVGGLRGEPDALGGPGKRWLVLEVCLAVLVLRLLAKRAWGGFRGGGLRGLGGS